MLTIESTAVVDATHQLTVQVPDSVPPGTHSVFVLIRDCGAVDADQRLPMRGVPDFVVRQKSAGTQPLSQSEAEMLDKLIAGESV